MTDDLEMMRASEMEHKKLNRLQIVAFIPLVCAVCGPMTLWVSAVSGLLAMTMLMVFMIGTPFGLLIGPLVLTLRKDLYVQPEDRNLAKRVKILAILDIAFGVLCVLLMVLLLPS